MLVSHAHRFIFLHGQKTAGSAITVSLLRYIEPTDLWLNMPSHGIFVDALKHGIIPPPATQPRVLEAFESLSGPVVVEKALSRPEELTPKERRSFAKAFHVGQPSPPRGPKVLGGWQHVPSRVARNVLGSDVWDNYYKFSFERNPWDRLISLYWWRWRDLEIPRVSFPDFVRAACSGDASARRQSRAKAASNWPVYAIGNKVVVDKLAKYEELDTELRAICSHLNIDFDGWIPRVKSKSRVRSESLANSMGVGYDSSLESMVAESFRREIAALGYSSRAP